MSKKYKGFSKLPEAVQNKMDPDLAKKYMHGGAVKEYGHGGSVEKESWRRWGRALHRREIRVARYFYYRSSGERVPALKEFGR